MKKAEWVQLANIEAQMIPNDTKCAAGWLLSQKDYKNIIKNDTACNSVGWYTLIEYKLVPNAHNSFIEDLQGIHDSYPPAEWKERFENMATRFNLNFNF